MTPVLLLLLLLRRLSTTHLQATSRALTAARTLSQPPLLVRNLRSIAQPSLSPRRCSSRQLYPPRLRRCPLIRCIRIRASASSPRSFRLPIASVCCRLREPCP